MDRLVADVPNVNKALAEMMSGMKLKRLSLLSMCCFFGLLLLSYGILTHYNAENAQLSQLVGEQRSSTSQVEQMELEIAAQETLLTKMKWNDGRNYGEMVDQLGKTLPRALRLEKLAVNKFDAKIEEEQHSGNFMEVTGTTQDLQALNNWLFVLKAMDWAKTVKLVNYGQAVNKSTYHFLVWINF